MCNMLIDETLLNSNLDSAGPGSPCFVITSQ